LFIGMAGQANADIFFDVPFPATGSFGYGGLDWTTGFENSDGSVATNDLNASTSTISGGAAGGFPADYTSNGSDVRIFGSDTGIEANGPGLSSISTTIGPVSGTISVAWDYIAGPGTLAENDPFIWLLGGDPLLALTPQSIAGFDGLSAAPQSGTFIQHLDAGALFSFGILTLDNLFGDGEFASVSLTGLEFTADIGGMNPVPVPPAFLLFGTALAGLGFFRKKKAAV